MPYVAEPSLSPRHLPAIAVIVLLHIGFILVLKNGLTHEVIALFKGPIEVKIVAEEIVPEKELPPPPINIEVPPPFVPLPELDIKLPPDPPQNTIIASSITAGQPPASVVTAPKGKRVSRTGAKLDSNRSPSPDEFYPPISKRLGEEGSVTVGVCVGPDGKVTGPAKLDQTSGVTRLDEAALKYMVRTRWTPATENGKAVQACTALSVKFVLKDGY